MTLASRSRSICNLTVVILPIVMLVFASFFVDPSRVHVSGLDHTLNDQVEYITTAQNLLRSGTLESSVIQTGTLVNGSFHHMPGYPVLLAGFYKVFGVNMWSTLLPGLLAFIFSTILIYLIGKKLFDYRVGFAAFILAISFSPFLIYSFTAMVEMPFIFAALFCFLATVYLNPRLQSSLVPFLLILPFLFRETGSLLVIPLAVYVQSKSASRKLFYFIKTILGSVIVLAFVYKMLFSSGNSQMFLKNIIGASFDDKYRNAFLSDQGPTASALLTALGSHFVEQVRLLGAGLLRIVSSFQFFAIFTICWLSVLSFAFGFLKWPGRAFSLSVSLLSGATLFLILLFYRIDGQVGMRMLLFIYPFLLLSCAAILFLYSGLRKTRITITAICAVTLLMNIYFFVHVSKAVTRYDDLDDQNTHFLEALHHDDQKTLVAPAFLALDYVLKHYPVLWAFEPANVQTWGLINDKMHVGTVIIRDDGLDKELAATLTADKMFSVNKMLDYRGVKIRVFQK
jgi:4-amino-4-deoxy-L-arabinose transferase-like glycosyltransferase